MCFRTNPVASSRGLVSERDAKLPALQDGLIINQHLHPVQSFRAGTSRRGILPQKRRQDSRAGGAPGLPARRGGVRFLWPLAVAAGPAAQLRLLRSDQRQRAGDAGAGSPCGSVCNRYRIRHLTGIAVQHTSRYCQALTCLIALLLDDFAACCADMHGTSVMMSRRHWKQVSQFTSSGQSGCGGAAAAASAGSPSELLNTVTTRPGSSSKSFAASFCAEPWRCGAGAAAGLDMIVSPEGPDETALIWMRAVMTGNEALFAHGAS